MRYFTDHGRKIPVDNDGSCLDQHSPKDPPLFHVVSSVKHTAMVVRCPRSLSREERENLKGDEK